MNNLEPILKNHPFFHGLKQEYFDIVLSCASNARFKEGGIIFREGDETNEFYLIRQGKVAIDITTSGCNFVTIQTLLDGEIVGWSWLIPPHRARFHCRAVSDTRAIALDGKCLREKCETNHDLGYELLKRLAKVFTERLENTRIQLLNIYGSK